MDEEKQNNGELEAKADEIIENDDELKIPVSYEFVEETLLSMFIQDDDLAAYIIQSGLRENHFLRRKNKHLFSLIQNMRLTKGICNFDLVAQELEQKVLDSGQTLLSYIGGLQELTKIMHLTDTNAMDIKVCEEYIRIIAEQSKLAKIKEVCRQLADSTKFEEGKIVDKIANLQQLIQEDGIDKGGLTSCEDLVLDAWNRFVDRRDHPEDYVPIETGFYYLNDCKVLAKKRVCVIGARTSIGKSVFVSNITTNMVLKGWHVLIFTPELDKDEYIDRMLCGRAHISINTWKLGKSGDVEVNMLDKAQKAFLTKAPLNLYIEDRGSQTASYILSSVKRHMLSHPVDVVVVDYLQKLRYYSQDTKRAITDIMDRFCSFAKDNNIAMIVVSQLRRSDKPEPELSDLKESGDIENFADSVVLLHRNSVHKAEERKKGWYRVAKNRQGKTTDNVACTFDENYLVFREVEPPDDESRMSEEEEADLPDGTNEQQVMDTVKREDENNGN